jgi:hypothetical protein
MNEQTKCGCQTQYASDARRCDVRYHVQPLRLFRCNGMLIEEPTSALGFGVDPTTPRSPCRPSTSQKGGFSPRVYQIRRTALADA